MISPKPRVERGVDRHVDIMCFQEDECELGRVEARIVELSTVKDLFEEEKQELPEQERTAKQEQQQERTAEQELAGGDPKDEDVQQHKQVLEVRVT